jgi:hypothetical protein
MSTCHQVVDDAQVARDELRPAAASDDRVDDGLPLPTPVHHDDPGADGRHRHGDALADAPSPAGHQRGLPDQGGTVDAQPLDQVPVDDIHDLLELLGWDAAR